MAPRKKKAASRKKALQKKIEKTVETVETSQTEPEGEPKPEPEPEPEAQPEPEPEPEPERPVSVRQHKKFGKFRCLLEEPKREGDDSNLQDVMKTDETEKIDDAAVIKADEIEKVSDAAVIKAEEIENVSDAAVISTNEAEEVKDTVVVKTDDTEKVKVVPVIKTDESEKVNDAAVVATAMDCTEVKSDEAELSEQLTQLNVLEDYSAIITEGDGEIFIDNVEGDISVECISEEVIAEAEEQIVEEPEIEELDEKNEEELEEDEEKAIEVEEKPKKPKKKSIKSRKALPKSVTSKVKAIKSQLVLEAQNSNSDASSASESSIRRSSRIKSITVLKQKAKGHGLVKKALDSDTSENSNSSHVDSEKVIADPQVPSPLLAENEPTKPVKVKSRWRRSSELEMSIASPTVVNKTSPESPEVNEKLQKAAEEEVTLRLKQFIHLKENQYLTERISCKEAKKMTCDCFLTHEEIERGEYGCGEDCLNRLLMIEW